MIWLYSLAALAILQGIVALIDGIRAARYMRKFRPSATTCERVVVFCPCKGVEPEFEKNIRSILEQDYPSFEVRFIVDSEKDPANQALRGMGISDILVAGKATNRGQKVHNLAYAVERITAEIFVFCDSDARFPRNWLSRLTAGLDSGAIATGYRWYVVHRFHLPTLLRSAWNASVVSMLGDHSRNFAWGGSMAMRRNTFERLRILDAWRGAVSDDYAITRAAERAGAKIVFIPECLIPSHGECTWRELLEFTTRQIIITRVYHPRLWRIGFVAQIVFNTAFFGFLFPMPALALIIYLLSAAKASVRINSIPPALSKFAWFYILCTPLVALLYLYNMVRSALGTHIVWRQIHYKLAGPNETQVFPHASGVSGVSES